MNYLLTYVYSRLTMRLLLLKRMVLHGAFTAIPGVPLLGV
jgi:hypothetical protein